MAAEGTVTFHPSSMVCKTANIEGNVKFGAGCVVHPQAVIKATNGPIEFGDNNLVEELTTVENLSTETMVIGDSNVFELGCVIRAASIGNNNSFGVQSVVDQGVQVSNGCAIGIRCQVSIGSLAPRTVVYGEHNVQRTAHDDPPNPASQLEILRKIFPSYHYVRKSAGN